MNKLGVRFLYPFAALLLIFIIPGCSKGGKQINSLEGEAKRLYSAGSFDSSFSYYMLYIDSLYRSGSPLLPEKVLNTGRLLILHSKIKVFDRLPDIENIVKDSNDAAELYRLRGERCLQTDDLVNAEKYFNLSSGIYLRGKDTADLARILNRLSEVKLSANKFQETKAFLEQSGSLISKISGRGIVNAENLMGYGNYFYRTGNFREALKFYEESFNLYDSLKVLDGKAKALNNIGNSWFRLFRIEKALACFNEALKIRKSIFGEEHPHSADTYNNLGLIYDYFGEPDRAIDYYTKALTIRENIFGRESKVVGKTLTNYANALKDFGDYAKAESLYIKSVQIFEHYNVNDPDIAVICINLGEVLAGQDKYKDAINYLERGVKLLTDNYGEKHLWTAMAKLNLSVCCWSDGKYEAADQLLNSAYASAKSFGEADPVLADMITEYGFRESFRGNYKKALKYYEEALNILVPGKFKDFKSLPEPGGIPNDKRIIKLLTYEAEALGAVSPGNLKYAYNCLKLAGAVIDNIRMGFKEESSGVLLGKEVRETYSTAVEILYKIYEKEKDQNILNEAFRIFEKSKSAVLLSRNIELRAKNAAGIPDSLLEKERMLKMRITALTLSGEEEEKAQLLQLKQNYLELLDTYQKNYPVYYRLKFNTDVISTDQVQKNLLQEGNACISYFVTENSVYSILLTKTFSGFIKVPSEIKIADAVASYRKGMIESNYTLFAASAFELYTLLIKSLEQWIKGKALIIIPDGVLNLTAFDTFIDSPPAGQKGDYKELRYLIYKYRISYAYSCSLLLENLTYSSPENLSTTLGFAPY